MAFQLPDAVQSLEAGGDIRPKHSLRQIAQQSLNMPKGIRKFFGLSKKNKDRGGHPAVAHSSSQSTRDARPISQRTLHPHFSH